LRSETLIVVAAYDHSFDENLKTFHGGDLIRADTSEGGHPSAAYVRAFRSDPWYRSYLFLQDSLVGRVPDVVEPFRSRGSDVVAWGLFPLFFDNDLQARWVVSQYPPPHPPFGIFGPIFFATRKAMQRLEDKRLFPETPPNRLMAQGTERAWALAFHAAGIPVDALGGCTTDGVRPNLFPEDKTFTKIFAGRA
jgi:hypothetical protein